MRKNDATQPRTFKYPANTTCKYLKQSFSKSVFSAGIWASCVSDACFKTQVASNSVSPWSGGSSAWSTSILTIEKKRRQTFLQGGKPLVEVSWVRGWHLQLPWDYRCQHALQHQPPLHHVCLAVSFALLQQLPAGLRKMNLLTLDLIGHLCPE